MVHGATVSFVFLFLLARFVVIQVAERNEAMRQRGVERAAARWGARTVEVAGWTSVAWMGRTKRFVASAQSRCLSWTDKIMCVVRTGGALCWILPDRNEKWNVLLQLPYVDCIAR